MALARSSRRISSRSLPARSATFVVAFDREDQLERVEHLVEIPLARMRVLRRVLFDRLVDFRVERLQHEGTRVELAFEIRATIGIDHAALLVHHVVVLENVLANLVVVLLDLPLSALDRLRHEARFDRLLVGEADALHDVRHALAAEEPHHFVFERDVEARRSRIALTARAAAQLIVDAPRLVALRADDVQAAVARDAVAELDVGAAAGHVGGDRHLGVLAGILDDLGFLLVILRVEHVALDAFAPQHRGEQLALLDRARADEHRPALLMLGDDLVDDRFELGAFRSCRRCRSCLCGPSACSSARRRRRGRRCRGTRALRSSPYRSCRRGARRGGKDSGT